MTSLAVEQLGKCYYMPGGAKRPAPKTAGEFLAACREWLRGRGTSGWPWRPRPPREFWALRNVSFATEPGTVLGIIGPNGAGKTTLLKILARVTPPTEGRVVGSGRVVSLLELGAGFNPEVSARENIFMNAAMYGVPKADVLEHFDEIIEFSEIGEFVDSPLKFYSSGMYLRLAFSVAVNMKPDVLLADEILAVGDLAFQERCLDRVGELAKEGLTVLFVSHDMEAITRVCGRVMWLSGGQIVKEGDPEEVVTDYQNAAWAKADAARSERGRQANRFAEILGARLVSESGKEIGAASLTEDVFVRIRFVVKRGPLRVRCGFDLYLRTALLFRSMDAQEHDIEDPGVYEGWARIPKDLLSEAMYTLNASVVLTREDKQYSLLIYNALSFMTYATKEPDGSPRPVKGALIAPRLDWKLVKQAEVVKA